MRFTHDDLIELIERLDYFTYTENESIIDEILDSIEVFVPTNDRQTLIKLLKAINETSGKGERPSIGFFNSAKSQMLALALKL
jgi:hypothetical protein